MSNEITAGFITGEFLIDPGISQFLLLSVFTGISINLSDAFLQGITIII
ncbi:MAG: hypothetical protein ABI416_00915 [Ginsengibacter sp.]